MISSKRCFILLTLVINLSLSHSALALPEVDTSTIERITGLKGTSFEEESVFKVKWPRTDVKVRVDNWPMPPFMGLTSWAAFKPGKSNELMVMGDLVLFPDEVSPVMDTLFAEGLTVTALHNHFLYEQPRVMFMHIAGEGDAETLATGVRAAFDKVQEIRLASPDVSSGFGPPLQGAGRISATPLEAALRARGTTHEGMVKFVFGRTATMECGCEVSKEMGVNTWAAFAGSDSNAVVDGDFVVREEELQPVLATLRQEGIHVVAIHNHMIGETPRYIFLHYWGRGPASDLAVSLRKALDQTSTPERE